jgi:hypothetical protein
MNVPTQPPEHFLTETIAVTRHARGMVGRTVAFDAQRERARSRWIPNCEVESIASAAELRDHLVPPRPDDSSDLLLERALDIAAGSLEIDAKGLHLLLYPRGVVHIAFEMAYAITSGVAVEV